MIALLLMVTQAWAAPPSAAPIGRGKSLCEQDPAACAWGGKAPERRTLPSTSAPAAPKVQDRVKTTQAGPTRAPELGNLPSYLAAGSRSVAESQQEVVVVAEKPRGALLPGLRAGDILQAVLDQSIKASPSVPTPIRARVAAGRFRGAFVLGSATFDRELKRILLTFESLRLPKSETTYAFKAAGLAPSGQVGLEGDHHTQEGAFFVGEVLAATAAGVADATTQRTQTALGTYQTEPTVANAGKQGAVQALSKTAERMAERARTAPEYTEIEAGRDIQILIEQSPVEVGDA
jgi:hypothetical protein